MTKLFRLFVLLLTVVPCFSFSSDLLYEEDVRKTVDKLIDYHVGTQDMTTDILLRSLSGYFQAFDPYKSYLTEKEVQPFLQSTEVKQNLLHNYKENNFSIYREMGLAIKQSILRARAWRAEWLSRPQELLVAASQYASLKKPTQWADTEQNTQDRHYSLLLSYIASYLSDNPKGRYVGREEDLVQLCEKQIKACENPYLAINDYGHPMTSEEEAHYFHVRIVKSMAHSLDAHTTYFSNEEALAMRIQLEKGMCGIGIILKEDIDGIMVREIIAGGPADKTKELQVNDILLSVDGTNITNLPFRAVLDQLRGLPGSEVTLHIRRG